MCRCASCVVKWVYFLREWEHWRKEDTRTELDLVGSTVQGNSLELLGLGECRVRVIPKA